MVNSFTASLNIVLAVVNIEIYVSILCKGGRIQA